MTTEIGKLFLALVLMGFTLFSCQTKKSTDTNTLSDDSLFNLVQYRTFQYFWDGAEPTSGAARERYHMDNDYPDNDKNIVTHPFINSRGIGFKVFFDLSFETGVKIESIME